MTQSGAHWFIGAMGERPSARAANPPSSGDHDG
jgi:hypothetical protein